MHKCYTTLGLRATAISLQHPAECVFDHVRVMHFPAELLLYAALLSEGISLTDVCDGVQVYKEYRNFMINKYREDLKRKLTFTECRKLLAGQQQ